jgi:hypothetical protein
MPHTGFFGAIRGHSKNTCSNGGRGGGYCKMTQNVTVGGGGYWSLTRGKFLSLDIFDSKFNELYIYTPSY